MALTRERIVAEAIALIDEDGLEGLSMRRLAARLGVRAPALYYHVADKSALINELLVVLFERCLALMPETATWQDWMREFGRAIWKVQREMKAAPLLILTAQLDDEHFERSVQGIRAALARFDGDRNELIAMQSAVQAVVTGWSLFANSAYAAKMARLLDFEEQALRSVDALVNGWEESRITPQPEREGPPGA